MPSRLEAAAACGVCAAAFALATPLLAEATQPGYQSCSQFISELGESGAPHATQVSLGGFLPTGVLTLLFTWLTAAHASMTPRARRGLLLFSTVGWAYIVTAVFPCDPGCPLFGSTKQMIHNVAGALEYLGGGFGLIVFARSWPVALPVKGVRPLSVSCGVVVLAAFVGLLAPPLEPMRGMIQRAAEAALFLWVTVCSVQLYASGRMQRVARRGPARPSA